MRTSRRELLQVGAATVATVTVSGCTTTLSSGSALQSQLDEVASTTETYSDPEAALRDGFRITGPAAPGQGWHFVNNERVRAAAKEGPDRSKPQVLTYDTDLNLVAVEWAVPVDAVDESPDLFDDDGAEATEKWHTHDSFTHVFANGNGQADDPESVGFEALTTADNWSAFRPPNTDLSPGDEASLKWGVESPDADDGNETRVVDIAATHPSLETLHVWVHRENPEGVFHPTHPDVAGGSEHDHDH